MCYPTGLCCLEFQLSFELFFAALRGPREVKGAFMGARVEVHEL